MLNKEWKQLKNGSDIRGIAIKSENGEVNLTDEAVDYIMPLIQGEQDIHYQNGVPIHFKLSN